MFIIYYNLNPAIRLVIANEMKQSRISALRLPRSFHVLAMTPINPAIIVVILNPSLCHSERSEESCRYAQDRLRVLPRGSAEEDAFIAQNDIIAVLHCRVNK
jgi:hypothetical protein